MVMVGMARSIGCVLLLLLLLAVLLLVLRGKEEGLMREEGVGRVNAGVALAVRTLVHPDAVQQPSQRPNLHLVRCTGRLAPQRSLRRLLALLRVLRAHVTARRVLGRVTLVDQAYVEAVVAELVTEQLVGTCKS